MALAPLAFLVALGLWAGRNLERLPQRFLAHSGSDGTKGWVAATPAAVFGFLAGLASVCLLMLRVAWGLLHWSRRISTSGAGAAGERRFRRRNAQWLIVNEYFLAGLAWLVLVQPSAAAFSVWIWALMAAIAGFLVSLMRAGQDGSRATASVPMGNPTRPPYSRCLLKVGLLYINPADPSIMIENRFGIGYPLNFGNRWTWLMLGAVLALMLVPVAAGLTFFR